SNRDWSSDMCSSDLAAAIEKNEDDKTSVVDGATVILPLAGLINKEEEIARLNKERDRLSNELKRVHGKLSNEKFVANAPENVVLQEKEKEAKYQSQYDEVSLRLQSLQ